MADEPELTPERCREHAEACRNMARAERNKATRKNLEDIAAAWEQLCDELGEIEKGKKR
jgi:hypothetical protein